MLKKYFFLFLTLNLFALEDSVKSKITNSQNTKILGIGLAVFVAYTIIPNMVDNAAINGNTYDFGTLKILAGAAVGVYGISEMYSTGKNMISSCHSDDAKKAQIAEIKEKNRALISKRELRECLMQHKNGQRNSMGIPTECENVASMFALIAGQPGLDAMTTTFNDLYRS